MSLLYPPKRGDVLMCRFPDGHSAPEMVKTRPVLVLNSNAQIRANGGLVTVVPISMTAPDPVKPWHVQMPLVCIPQPMRHLVGDRWAKCDMVYTYHYSRLDFATGPKVAAGKRKYHSGKADLETMRMVRRCVAEYLAVREEVLEELRATQRETE